MPLKFDLKRLRRRKRVFISLDCTETECYEFETRSFKDAILSKPDILIRKLHVAEPSELISSIKFPTDLDDSKTWRPRISLEYTAENEKGLKLCNLRTRKWTANIDGVDCIWDLSFNPFVLSLRTVGSKDILAVFTLRDRWAQGPRGDVGGLCIMDEEESLKGKKDIICTLVGVLVFWERAGKMVYVGSDGWGF
ncbi:hypothetical protein BKA65DRAFT_519391 [Rhexocercosporidium sp. MPI-PUGE-AT-0058]|nr:hypothetical protein BKA65DRAFT_519391 [Rhexocercosporidium sp. MPI-PUGE-AT-0058]